MKFILIISPPQHTIQFFSFSFQLPLSSSLFPFNALLFIPNNSQKRVFSISIASIKFNSNVVLAALASFSSASLIFQRQQETAQDSINKWNQDITMRSKMRSDKRFGRIKSFQRGSGRTGHYFHKLFGGAEGREEDGL